MLTANHSAIGRFSKRCEGPEAEVAHPLGLLLHGRHLADDGLVEALLGLEDVVLFVGPPKLVLSEVEIGGRHVGSWDAVRSDRLISPIQIVTTLWPPAERLAARRPGKSCHPGRMAARSDLPRPDAPTTAPPVPRAAPGAARGPWGRPDRRLVLAAGQGRSGGHRPPREPRTPTPRRPWPAPPGSARTLFDEMVARIEETDLSVPGPQGSLALLRPHRRGQQLRHPLPAAGRGPDGGRRRPGR